MHGIFSLLIIATCFLPLYLFFAIMPYLSRKTECFGIGIPGDKYDTPELSILRKKYRNTILGIGGLIIMAVFIAVSLQQEHYAMLSMISGLLLLFCAEGIIYLQYHKKMKSLKAAMGWMSGKMQTLVADTAPVSKKEYASPFWFLLYPVIIMLTTFTGLLLFDNMPDRVPLQFDLHGSISHWANKSIGLVFYAPLTQLFISILMVFLYYIIRKAKRQIDASNPEESMERISIFRRAWSLYTVFCGLLLLVIFGCMQLTFVGVIKNPSTIFAVSITPTVILVVAAIALSVGVGQGGSRVKVRKYSKNPGTEINRDDDRYWKFGIFYVNHDDPVLFLEKRFGIGWTLNMARPLAWVILSGLLVIIVAFVLVSTLLVR